MTEVLSVEMQPKTQKLWEAVSRGYGLFDQDDVHKHAAIVALKDEAKSLLQRECIDVITTDELHRLAEIKEALALVKIEVRYWAIPNCAQWRTIGRSEMDWIRI